MTDEELLAKALENPNLLAELMKLSKANEKVKAVKEVKARLSAYPAYVNRVVSCCKLCGSEHVSFVLMEFDPNHDCRFYRSAKWSTENKWPSFPIQEKREKLSTCKGCISTLQKHSKETLISMLMQSTIRENTDKCVALDKIN